MSPALTRAPRPPSDARMAAFALACGDSNDGGGGNNACDLATSTSTIGGQATYTASVTGNGAISSLVYATDGGNVTVNNPTLPYNQGVTLTTGRARISTTGTVSSGSITTAYSVTPAGGGALESDSESCSR